MQETDICSWETADQVGPVGIFLVREAGVEPALDAVSGHCLCQLGYSR